MPPINGLRISDAHVVYKHFVPNGTKNQETMQGSCVGGREPDDHFLALRAHCGQGCPRSSHGGCTENCRTRIVTTDN
jgi:hypothetical protein